MRQQTVMQTSAPKPPFALLINIFCLLFCYLPVSVARTGGCVPCGIAIVVVQCYSLRLQLCGIVRLYCARGGAVHSCPVRLASLCWEGARYCHCSVTVCYSVLQRCMRHPVVRGVAWCGPARPLHPSVRGPLRGLGTVQGWCGAVYRVVLCVSARPPARPPYLDLRFVRSCGPGIRSTFCRIRMLCVLVLPLR